MNGNGVRNAMRERYLILEGDPGSGGPGGAPGGDPPAPQEWFTGLPEDLKADAAVFEPFKAEPVTKVLSAYRDAAKAAAENAAPKTPKDYKVSLPADFPKEIPVDQATLEGMLGVAHSLGMSNRQAQNWVNVQAKAAVEEFGVEKQKLEAAEKALKADWGDKYDENKALVDREMKALPKDMVDIIAAAGLTSHPNMIRLVHLLATARREGQTRIGDGPGGGVKSAAEVLYGDTPK